jgi:7,8-dihydropterin-6-yl-methyl-4-(beta-D-ribofuranosyl)aminobenzene 5'-phosphate synthase
MTTETPIRLVDRVEVLTLVDNVVDLLLASTDIAKRIGPATAEGWNLPALDAPLFETGETVEVPVAEHGLSYLVSITSEDKQRTVLFDTGSSPNGVIHNMDILGVDPGVIEAIVLSHGHFDHTMGLNGLAKRLDPLPPLVVHPDCWLQRRVDIPDRDPYELPALSKDKIQAAGFPIAESTEPYPLLDGGLLVTGVVERRTEYEQGLALHQALRDGEWQPDPFLFDDQALVANLRGKGLVVVTGCSHSGVVNTVRYARKITGVDEVYAVLGGFHLGGPLFEQIIPATIDAIREFDPKVLSPAHCTGWKAIHALARAFPEAFLPGSVGTRYVLEGTATVN